MLTMQQALNGHEYHQDGCKRAYGPRGGLIETILRVRRNGTTKTWKRRPDAYRIPVKVGYSGFDYITDREGSYWHTSIDCPLNVPCHLPTAHVCTGGDSHAFDLD